MSELLPREFRYRHELHEQFGGWLYRYIIVTPYGAIDFHVTTHERGPAKDLDDSAGLERHYRNPPPYMADKAPSLDSCPTLGGPCCWHDGISLYATENLYPLWKYRSNEQEMFSYLLDDAKRLSEDFTEGGDE